MVKKYFYISPIISVFCGFMEKPSKGYADNIKNRLFIVPVQVLERSINAQEKISVKYIFCHDWSK